MDSLVLREILRKIVASEPMPLAQLAVAADLNRSNLSNIYNATESKEVKGNTINKLKKAFPAYFQHTTSNVSQETHIYNVTGDKDKTIECLVYNNKTLAESNSELVRMHREFLEHIFSSKRLASASEILKEKGKVSDRTEQMTSGNKEKRSPVYRKQKGIVKS